ncbi:MAG TPA: helix-turn-helix transcriptional regulator [Terriglobales bacterium]|jgi:transcriptional regulator with XRE-family HTH domain|nr:helix-turn-helix transcriptional regulator [Terriglobales bacterium]
MTPAEHFGSLLRSARAAKKLKIWQVSEKAGVEVKHLGRIERGEKKPSFDLIIALAGSLDVSPARFFDFEAGYDRKTVLKQIQKSLLGRDAKQLRRAQLALKLLFDA